MNFFRLLRSFSGGPKITKEDSFNHVNWDEPQSTREKALAASCGPWFSPSLGRMKLKRILSSTVIYLLATKGQATKGISLPGRATGVGCVPTEEGTLHPTTPAFIQSSLEPDGPVGFVYHRWSSLLPAGGAVVPMTTASLTVPVEEGLTNALIWLELTLRCCWLDG